MKNIEFKDPSIESSGQFDAKGYSITAPLLTISEAEKILSKIHLNSSNFFSGKNTSIDSLNRAFSLWTRPDYSLLQKAVPALSEITQFSMENIICFGLAPLENIKFSMEMFGAFQSHLRSLISSEQYRKFTTFGSGYIKAFGTANIKDCKKPENILQIIAGNVVGPSWITACLGAMIQSPQIIKLPHSDLASFMFFMQTLAEVDPNLRKTTACGYFSSEDDANDYFLKKSDMIIAMGSDETMRNIQKRLSVINPQARFISHGLKISFQVVAKEYSNADVAELAAWGITAYDGNGCFSPANIFVETGGELSPEQFAEALAEALKNLSEKIPPKRNIGTAEKVTRFRNSYIQRKLLGENIDIFKSLNTDYTVILDKDNPMLTPTCQERVVIIKPVKDIYDIPKCVNHLSLNLQTAGIAVPTGKILKFAESLGSAGVTNFKIIGTEYSIDISEPHDGIFDIVQLFWSDDLRWTSIGFTDTDQAMENARIIKSGSLDMLEKFKTNR